MSTGNLVDLASLSHEEKLQFRNKYDVFFFDMDGTLAKMNKDRIPGAPEAIATLAEHGKEMFVFTDNCMCTRANIAKSIRETFPHFKEENIMNSSWLLANHMRKIGYSKKIYVMGDIKGIVKELEDAEFEIQYEHEMQVLELADIFKLKLDPEVGAVVLGVDFNFSYLKLMKAVNYLKDPSVLFLTTHCMVVAHFDPIIAGAAALAIPIEGVSGRKSTICGKGGPVAMEYVQSLGYDMRRCIFVGDGLDNDMTFGNLCGMDTLLVLGGTANLEHVEESRRMGRTKEIPTYYAESVAVLKEIFYN